MATKSSSRPVWSKVYFPLEVVVFDFDGRYSIKLSRSFRRDPESEWEKTSEYLTDDCLLVAAKLLSEADTFIRERKQQAYETSRDEARARRAS